VTSRRTGARGEPDPKPAASAGAARKRLPAKRTPAEANGAPSNRRAPQTAASAVAAPAPRRGRQPVAIEPAIEATRDQILAHAARLFRHHGYAATTLRQIADAAGIKAGSIYYHFGSKDEILGEVLDAGMAAVTNAVRERIDALPASASHRDRIAAAIDGHLYGLLHHGDETVQDPLDGIGRGEHLREERLPIVCAAQHDVGERAADVDAEVQLRGLAAHWELPPDRSARGDGSAVHVAGSTRTPYSRSAASMDTYPCFTSLATASGSRSNGLP